MECLLFVTILVGLSLLARAIKARLKPQSEKFLYELKASLTTPAERSFLGCLDSVLSPEIRVFVKVRLADIFSVRKIQNRRIWTAAFNRIQSKHIDFVLCRSDDLSILLAIELDDKSHAASERQKRDAFLNYLFATSEIKLLRVEAKRSYDVRELAQRLNEMMH